MDNPDPPAKKRRRRPGIIRRYFAWFIAFFGADPFSAPWNDQGDEDETREDQQNKTPKTN